MSTITTSQAIHDATQWRYTDGPARAAQILDELDRQITWHAQAIVDRAHQRHIVSLATNIADLALAAHRLEIQQRG